MSGNEFQTDRQGPSAKHTQPVPQYNDWQISDALLVVINYDNE